MRVFVQFGSGLGSMSRVYPIIKELKILGWEIRYSGYPSSKKYMESINVEELDEKFCFNDKILKEPSSDWQSPEEFWEMMGYNDISWINRKVEYLVKQVKKFSPDLIICDLGILSWFVAKILNIPLVTITQSCYHPERKYRNFRWWEKEETKISSFCLKDNINLVLEQYGVAQISCFEEIFVGDLTIIPSYEEIDWIKKANKYNSIFVGPILYDEKVDISNKTIRFFDESKEKIIFCYTGRFYDNVGESGFLIFRSLLDSFANDSNFNIVIAVGGDEELEIAKEYINQKFDAIHNIQVLDFLPMNFAYRNSDLVIHHGGHGSCLGQIKYCVPSVIVPTHSEREYNARVFEKMGFAEVICKEGLSELKNAVFRVLNNSEYAKRIKRFKGKKELECNYGLKVAIDRILSLVGK